jgi:hypothetical protein
MKKWILFALFIFSSGLYASESLSDQVEISVTPVQPLVLAGNFEFDYHGQERTVRGPWFRTQLRVSNTSSQTVTVATISYKVKFQGGEMQLTSIPSLFNFAVDCGDKSMRTLFTDFGEFLSGDSGYVRLTAHNLPSTCPRIVEIPAFYVDQLPESQSQFEVEVTVEGWFGPYGSPSDRFTKVVHFRTQ